MIVFLQREAAAGNSSSRASGEKATRVWRSLEADAGGNGTLTGTKILPNSGLKNPK